MKISVLFVDDDPDILRGLKRILRSKQGWKIFFAEGGAEALGIMAENDIGVVVMDMRMPGMDGLELLTTVQEHYPHVIRMVLSGYAEQEVMLRSAKLAHQFFAKPCDADVLIKSIEHTWLLRDLINDERLRDLITGITDMPSLPSSYAQLMEYIQNPDASIKQIGDIIASDMTMTAKVLQLVNSAFFSLPQNVVDPARAVSLLGIENLKPLLLYVHIFSTFDSSKEIRPYLADLWKHSIMVGRLAREIAAMESSVQATRENALTAGVLHDIGKLAILRATGQKTGVDCVFIADERDLFGASHPAMGAYLLGLWAIPAPIVEAVAFHHRPSESGDDGFTALTAVHVADALVSNDYPDSSVIPGLDYSYLEVIDKAARLPQWIECCRRVKERESS